MNVFLWIVAGLLAAAFLVAGLLAAAFLVAGLTKTSQPKEKLATSMAWVEDFSPRTVRTIGTLEILAALGLVLPAAVDVATVLVPLAATGLVAMMVGAAITHARRKEPQMIAINVVLLALAAVVAWGRFGPYAFGG